MSTQKFRFVRIAKLLSEVPTVENKMLLLKCFQDLYQLGKNIIDKKLTKWPSNQTTSVEWMTDVDDRDYAHAVREWIEVGRKGCQFVINKIQITNEMKEAQSKYVTESEKLEDL